MAHRYDMPSVAEGTGWELKLYLASCGRSRGPEGGRERADNVEPPNPIRMNVLQSTSDSSLLMLTSETLSRSITRVFGGEDNSVAY